ncbi:hypothetical protein K9M74_01465 [Candidatus Woesearchaeota archaeon]|nr:hypothetical protein [Candidatus Woesearchaeota archaeon]
MAKKKIVKQDHHHTIPLSILLIPCAIIIISLFLFIAGLKDWAYMTIAIAIIIAILIHREEE